MLAFVAVLAPTVALSFIQYRSLVELEAKTKAATQENLRRALDSVGRRTEEHFRSLADEALKPVAAQNLSPHNLDPVARHFAAFRQRRPGIDRLFVVVSCPSRADNFALIDVAGAVRHIAPGQFRKEHDLEHAFKAFQSANMLRGATGQREDVLFWQDACDCGNTPAHEPQSYVFVPLGDANGRGRPGFVGLTISSSYLKDRFFPQFIPALLSPLGGAGTADLGLAVLDEKKSELYATPARLNSYEVKLPFTPVFPKMELAVGYRGTTLETLARKNFYQGLLLTACVLSLLIIGIVLTLRAAAREMKLAQAKSTFVSNVSHELKTPLALIRLFAETLELGRVKNAEKTREYYRIIIQESRRLTRLINNILDFARIEEGRREYRLAATDVAEVVEEVLKSYEYQIASAGFDLRAEIAPKLPSVMIDRDALAQAALNLLNNAIKYSTEVKRITVRVTAREGSVAIEVTDCGIGIPRAEQEKIFEKFYRVGAGLTHNTKGSGLGLTLVRHIVEAHRGWVTVESAPGKGSKFTILLPASVAETTSSNLIYGNGEY
ncbi:MAG TPA: HAMP domain-containing sensor histidine kinase [Blastocatellia bacterium]